MQVLLYHGEAETGAVGDLLIASTVTNYSRDVLLSSGQASHMGQLFSAPDRMKVFALDEKMRPRYAGRADLLKPDCGAYVRQVGMTHHFTNWPYRGKAGPREFLPMLFEPTATFQNLTRYGIVGL